MPLESQKVTSVPPGETLRLMSLNIQVGLHSSRYRHYVTQSWRHVVPTRSARNKLEDIAAFASRYDVVALQEADAGSMRTSQLDQVAHLAKQAGFPYWQTAVTRNLRPFARNSLGCLSRWPLDKVQYHPLPGWLPGRGALELEICPPGYKPLRLIIVHLALVRRTRAQQLDFIASLVGNHKETLVMGDLNCDAHELEAHAGLCQAGIRSVNNQLTFPSWRPLRTLDHILITPAVDVTGARVPVERLSDHLPVAADIRLKPDGSN